MKQLISILLLAGLLTQTFSKLSIVLGFELNRDYIAKNLCENRKNPEKHCRGCCLLKKELKDQDNQEKQSPARSGTEEVLLLFHETQEMQAAPSAHIIFTTPSLYRAPVSDCRVQSIFHPPRA